MKEKINSLLLVLEKVRECTLLRKDIAHELEASILDAFPDADDDDRFENLLHVLASYEPQGGEFMYGEDDLRKECNKVYDALRLDC